jgi:hypothetical protein
VNDLVEALVAEGEAETPLGISNAYRSASFDGETARAAADQLQRRPDASALQLLLALRREAPDTYQQVPAELRAQVLVSALRDLPFLNDFGWMEPDGHGHDRTAAQALLELGDAARAPLAELLDDDRPAPLSGSEAATLSSVYGYRRCDFAYRYLCKLLRRDAPFAGDVAARDAAIAALRKELRA